MKKTIVFLLLFASACAIFQNRQQKAELTVKEYIHYKNPKAHINKIKFTDLDPNGNVIGVIENKMVYDSSHRPMFIRTVYYMLNKDLTHVNGVYTN
jgi:hypothetical protein